MSLPFKPLPHRLRPGDVLPVQLVNRLGERLGDAYAMFSEQHRHFDPNGGIHQPVGQPIASRLFARPAGVVTQYDVEKWADAPPVWSYGAWDGDARWEFWNPARIVGKVAGLNAKAAHRGRVFVEMDTAIAAESALSFGIDFQAGLSEFIFEIPNDILKGARLVCIQVF